ncbi:MAG: hypothetical protein KGL90_11700 [Burkholderiales bacterium]|nr:hypothetical protein [Burkholderiales bacterium]
MKALAQRLCHSPTLMTWGSMGARLLGVMLVLPLVLVKFPAADIAVWQLFATILTLQLILDFGLSPTFSRMLSYALGGAKVEDLKVMAQIKRNKATEPDIDTIRAVYGTLQWLYPRFGVAILLVTAVLGTWAINKPVSQMLIPDQGWLAWGVILLTSLASIWANAYSSAIQGFNQIATVRRWEILTALGQIGSSYLVLSLGGGLLMLVCVGQAWVVFSMWRNRRLVLRIEPKLKDCPHTRHPLVLAALWPATWRSGIGILMSQGIIQVSGVIYGQLASAAEVASYLFALRVITTISQFSQAPFYSKLPAMAILYAQKNFAEQTRMARKGMAMASWVFTLGTMGVALTIAPALAFIGSKVYFVSPTFWGLMSLAFFVERVGAMHIQLYSITNHIVWHIANGITGCIMLALAYRLYPSQGIAAFPIAMLAAYGLFYTVFAMYKTSTTYQIALLRFESGASLPPAIAQLLVMGGLLISQR